MSTICRVVVCSSSARMSEIVRFGRLKSSFTSMPLVKLTALKRNTKMVFGPTCRIRSRIDSSKPRMSAVIPTIDVMPMTTPRTVSPERILFRRTVSNAITMTSLMRPIRNAIRSYQLPAEDSLAPQRLDWIQPRGAHRRIQPVEEPDERRDADAERHRPRLDRRRDRRERRDDDRRDRAQDRADDSAEHRQHHRLGDDLRADVGSPRAERLAQPDLARALG